MTVRAHLVWLSATIALTTALALPFLHGSLDANDSPTTTWDFEAADALQGWTPANATLALVPGEGASESQAASITIKNSTNVEIERITAEAHYPLVVQPGAVYEFGGQYVSRVGKVDWAKLTIVYRDASGDFIMAVRDHLISPGLWQPQPEPAPCNATQARLQVLAYGELDATVYIDNLYLKESAPSSPCPTPVPTATTTHTPTASPTQSPTPTPADTATSTPAPPATSTAVAPSSSTPQATSTTADTPTAVATTALALAGFEFTNGGFEEGAGGEPDAWESVGGLLMLTGSPIRSGSWSGAFFSSTNSTKWAYQTVSVEPANWYTLAAFIYHDDPWVESALLRISWYASTDGSGSALATVDSTAALASPEPAYRSLTTGPVMAPPGVHSARLRVLMRPVDGTNAVIYIDDVSFAKVDAPLPPTATLTSTSPMTSATASSPTPTGTPIATASLPTGTSDPTDTPVPTSALALAPTSTPTSPPVVQTAPLRLTNAGFEIAEDGVLTGWGTFGGLLMQTDAPVRSGAAAGAFFSSSGSTKWLYQTVAIEPEAWYQLDAFVYYDHAWVEWALLRVSWYASDDGSGSAMLSGDSTASLDFPAPGYRQLSTGPVQAPPGARSAKLRILLRPRDGTSALIYVDDVSFNRVAAPAFVEETAPLASEPPAPSIRTSQVLSSIAPAPAAVIGQQPSYTPMPAPVIRRHSLQTPDQLATPVEGDALWPWALLGATAGAGAVGWGAYWALRRRQGIRS